MIWPTNSCATHSYESVFVCSLLAVPGQLSHKYKVIKELTLSGNNRQWVNFLSFVLPINRFAATSWWPMVIDGVEQGKETKTSHSLFFHLLDWHSHEETRKRRNLRANPNRWKENECEEAYAITVSFLFLFGRLVLSHFLCCGRPKEKEIRDCEQRNASFFLYFLFHNFLCRTIQD